MPIDDENTLSVAWFFVRVPKDREPYLQGAVPTWISPIKDTHGRWISRHVINPTSSPGSARAALPTGRRKIFAAATSGFL